MLTEVGLVLSVDEVQRTHACAHDLGGPRFVTLSPRHLELLGEGTVSPAEHARHVALGPQIQRLREARRSLGRRAVEGWRRCGHPRTPENTFDTAKGERCRRCLNIRKREARARKRGLGAAGQVRVEHAP
jgi:hypothetical protein